MLSWSPTSDTSMSASLTPGNSAVSVTALSSSAMSTRGANTPPMLRPNQSSNSESIWFLNPRKCSASRCRSPHVGNHDLLTMVELLFVMGGDALHRLFAHAPRSRIVNIAEAQDSGHALLAIDHRQAAHLPALHQTSGFIEFVSLQAEHDAFSHHIACAMRLCIEARSDATADDIPVRHHADQAIIFADWNGTNIMLAHQPGELDNRRVGIDPLHTLVHGLFHFHGRLLLKCRPVITRNTVT